MYTDSVTMEEQVDEALRECFEDSRYLHSAGSGNVQALALIVQDLADLDLEFMDEDAVWMGKQAFLAGALQVQAMCPFERAWYWAGELLQDEAELVSWGEGASWNGGANY